MILPYLVIYVWYFRMFQISSLFSSLFHPCIFSSFLSFFFLFSFFLSQFFLLLSFLPSSSSSSSSWWFLFIHHCLYTVTGYVFKNMNADLLIKWLPTFLCIYNLLFCFVFYQTSTDDLTTLDNIFSKFWWMFIKTETF